jgi:hypothetical protein
MLASGSDFIPASDGQRFLIMEWAPTRPSPSRTGKVSCTGHVERGPFWNSF